jgi:hypothetical protein
MRKSKGSVDAFLAVREKAVDATPDRNLGEPDVDHHKHRYESGLTG